MSRGENSFAFDDRLIEYRSIGDQPRAKNYVALIIPIVVSITFFFEPLSIEKKDSFFPRR